MKFKKAKKTIAAAVRIEPDLYAHALQRVDADDSNFSRYVRQLIRADLAQQRIALMPAFAASH